MSKYRIKLYVFNNLDTIDTYRFCLSYGYDGDYYALEQFLYFFGMGEYSKIEVYEV